MREEIKVYKETRLPDGTLIQTTRRRLIARIVDDRGIAHEQPIEDSSITYENLVFTRNGGSERYKVNSLEQAMDHHEYLAGRLGRESGSYLANDTPTRMELIAAEDD